MANAFNVWARLSSTASHGDRSAKTAVAAKRHKTLAICISALVRNASSRRLARRTLSAVEQSTRLRRLARGWRGLAAAAAEAGASLEHDARLGTAEAQVAAAAEVARARAHRTARRLLGVARGRTALEAFVAWRGLVREGRGARLGAAALAARLVLFLWSGGVGLHVLLRRLVHAAYRLHAVIFILIMCALAYSRGSRYGRQINTPNRTFGIYDGFIFLPVPLFVTFGVVTDTQLHTV